MFGFDQGQNDHQQVYGGEQQQHEGKFSHELLAGGAAFEGMKLFEDHQRKEGKQVNHAFAKEALMGFVGGEVDKLVETKGRDYYDRERVHREARDNARDMYDQHYDGQDQYDTQNSQPNGQLYYNQDGGYQGGGGYNQGGGGYNQGNQNY